MAKRFIEKRSTIKASIYKYFEYRTVFLAQSGTEKFRIVDLQFMPATGELYIMTVEEIGETPHQPINSPEPKGSQN